MSLIENLVELIQEVGGIIGVDEIQIDDTFHHVRRGDKSVSYSAHPMPDGSIIAVALSHKTGQKISRRLSTGLHRPLTRSAVQDRIEAQRQAARLTELSAQAEAQRLVDECRPANRSHGYLRDKGISPLALLQRGGALIAPLEAVDGQTKSVQRIFWDYVDQHYVKRYLPGGRTRGCYYRLGELHDARRILICEGVATSHSIFSAMGMPTISAMSAGNLQYVAESIHAIYPRTKLTILADDDWKLVGGNVGVLRAEVTAAAIGRMANMIVPNFVGLERGEKDTDFNDLARLTSIAEVRRQITWSL
jgi:putative DNA primase/helicase